MALHLATVPTWAARPLLWPWLLLALFGNHALLSILGTVPRSRALGPNLRRLDDTETGLFLTFDDGPDPEVTPRVLDILGSDQRATFFFVGERVERHGALVREVVDRGHRVENHTHRHGLDFAFLGPGRLRREIERAQESIATHCGRYPRYFRSPAGVRSPWLEPILAGAGLQLVSWTRRGYDSIESDARKVLGRLLRGLDAGDILLLHDGVISRRPRSRAVLEVLPRLLDEIDRRGLRSIPLPAGGVSQAHG